MWKQAKILRMSVWIYTVIDIFYQVIILTEALSIFEDKALKGLQTFLVSDILNITENNTLRWIISKNNNL